METLKDVLGENDLDQYEAQSFDVLPVGTYLVEIAEADLEETRAKDGIMLKLVHEVIEPEEFKGRKIWKRINVRNKSAKAEQIGRGELRQLRDVCGLQGTPDALDFVAKTVVAHVVIRKASGDYPEQNEIRGYEPAGSKLAARAPTQPPAGKPAPAATSRKPWEK